ncbi:type II toxin-antitoxin system YoeB family toxin [Lentzea atacamensis]|nr:type II toxin-antitoxin system YoeB family toxin [Lentzea atacamensis]
MKDTQRNGNEGLGKSNPLKHGFQSYWSRRITDKHRLVYKSLVTRSESRHVTGHHMITQLTPPIERPSSNAIRAAAS